MNPVRTVSSPVSVAERRWVVYAALAGMLITTVPYWVGFASAGEAWEFTGFVFAVEDGNSYIAKMRLGAQGHWLFRTPYTAAGQRGVLAFLPYLLLGKLTSPPAQHEQLVVLFHLFRILAGVMAVRATYDFLAAFVQSVALRRLGTLCACFGGGLGWLLVLLGQGGWLGSLPLDFYSPETFGFLSLYGFPHLAVARALLLWGLLAYLDDTPAAGARAGLLWLMMGFFQPLTILVAWAAVGAHLVGYGLTLAVRRARSEIPVWREFLRRATIAGLVCSPFVVYSGLILRGDPFFRQWTAQNLILSPHPLHYLAAYGVMIPFAVAGALRLAKREPARGWLPLAWAVMLPALAYAPFNLQRRLPEGIWVAILALAMSAWDQAPTSWRKSVYFAAALLFPTTAFLLFGGLTNAANPARPGFRLAEEVAAFEYLDRETRPGFVILAAYETGNALPAWAPVRVVIGHGPESVGLADLRPRVEAFFRPETADESRLRFLAEFGVAYVFWGPAERALGGWEPRQAGYLQEVYTQGNYAIFRVDPAALSP